MDLRIAINSMGADLSKIIEEKLIKNNYPKCYGNMIPPTLMKVVDIDSELITSVTGSTEEEEIHDKDLKKYLEESSLSEPEIQKFIENRCLTKKGANDIEAYKLTIAEEYVTKIVECHQCPFIDTCTKLTEHFLSVIYLQENMQGD